MIKLLLMFLAGFILYSLVSGVMRPAKRRPSNRTPDGETMVEDPHCGTYVPQSDAFKATIAGKQLYFCSKKCLKEYKKAQNP
ncbi:MAG: YHS domain-containing protein [Desulfuromonadales bacterium]|nr:YHS domain-containing protein [Desulfuromonadales bacterium]MBN2792843.1 YHS domain-containing protein [Desulfuromonadales bacterium]